ncbi:hypothetical protein B7767_33895, partial [Streptomyces sp. 13-12-16]
MDTAAPATGPGGPSSDQEGPVRLRRGRTANARRTALALAVLAGTLGTGTLGAAPAAVAAPP